MKIRKGLQFPQRFIFWSDNALIAISIVWHAKKKITKKEKDMKRKLLNGAAILVLTMSALGLSACATDEGGTHLMGGRGQSGPMADEMMPGNQ